MGSSKYTVSIMMPSVLGIAISIMAIAWRSYLIHGIVKSAVPVDKWSDSFKGRAAFTITTLIVHVFWMITSVALFFGGQKGVRLVMWLWIIQTWLVIVLDTAFFGYASYQILSVSQQQAFNALVLLEQQNLAVFSIAPAYMLQLLIHIILAALTVLVGCYANEVSSNTTFKGKNFNQGRIMNSPEVDNAVYLPDQVPQVRQSQSVGHQNFGYSRSMDDMRMVPVGNRFKRYVPEDLSPDYNDRRARRYNTDRY